jgi:hypothetical protein
LSAGLPKSSYRIAMETLILQISNIVFYLNFSKSFYVNIISSKLFRRIFKEHLMIIYIRLTWWKMHVQPIETGTRTITKQENLPMQTITQK